jgi:hypothetical protein
VGTVALTATSAHARGKKPVVLDGHICTKVATSRHPTVVGHALNGRPAVVCGVSGNDTLKAKGAGLVILVAGPGSDTLIASSDPGARDILIGGSGTDTFQAGTAGDDVIETNSGDTIDCTTGATTVIAGDNQGDNENGDCQGSNVDNATQEWEGVVTATDGSTTMTIQWTDLNDAAQTWLDANGDHATVTSNISSAIVVVEGGGALMMGDRVETTANASGSVLTAVSVVAEPPNNLTCNSTLTGTIKDDLEVIGGMCTLSGATVEGDVLVSSGGSLSAQSATLEGNLASAGASSISIGHTNAQGDVHVETSTGAVTISNDTIEGDLNLIGNTGGVTVTSNIIDGDLNCTSNAPAPTGSGNTISGDNTGQCSGF